MQLDALQAAQHVQRVAKQQDAVVWPKWDPGRSTKYTFLDMAQEAGSRGHRPYVSLDGYNTMLMRPRSPISHSGIRDWKSDARRAFRPLSDPTSPSTVQVMPIPRPKQIVVRPPSPRDVFPRAVHGPDPGLMVPVLGDETKQAFFDRLYAGRRVTKQRADRYARRECEFDHMTGESTRLCRKSRARWAKLKQTLPTYGLQLETPDHTTEWGRGFTPSWSEPTLR